MKRLIFAFILSAGLVSAATAAPTIKDSRDGHNYKTLASGEFNWFTENLSAKQQGVCPEGTHVPDIKEWSAIVKDRFTGPRKKQNVKSFAGKTKGYYNAKDKKKKVKGKDAAYFAVAGVENRAMMLDLKRGSAKQVELPAGSVVAVRCVSERDIYAEKGIDRKAMTFVDPRDNQTYMVEEKAGMIWMKSNLKFGLKSAKQCFLEDTVFCERHGRFFGHAEAKKACPKGWHLPDDGEWRDYQKDQKIDWDNLGRGGCRDWDEYCDAENTGHYWSATSIKKNTGRSWEFRRVGKSINRTDESVLKGLYVRCVTDLK